MTTNYGDLPSEDLAWLAGLFQAEAHYSTDKRVRSDMDDPTNDPPPSAPFIKVEMIEKDVMEKVANLTGKKVAPQKRLTMAGNKVYRVNITGRSDVAALLAAILPYTVGEVRIQQIKELLAVCDEYDAWVARGGKSKQAARAARIGNAKRAAAKAEKERLKKEGSSED